MLSNYYSSARAVTLASIRLAAMKIGFNYIDSSKQAASCFNTELATLEGKYNQALYNNYMFMLSYPFPPLVSPLPTTNGGRRKRTRRHLKRKQTTRKKIGKGRSRKI
jgi:hypothetical protein